MLAFERHLRTVDADRCPSCHTERSDWVDGKGRRLAEPAWIVEVESCPGCDVIDAARSEIPEADRHRSMVRLRAARPSDFIELD